MTVVTRFIFHVDENWEARVEFPGPDAGTRGPRRLREAQGRRFRFPLPPKNDMPPKNAPHYKFCVGDEEEIDKVYTRILDRKPNTKPPGDIQIFGQYLFQTLVGQEWWDAICKLADNLKPDFIELALSWRASDVDLNRLNWELMHDGRNFLASGLPRGVAITRLVSGGREARRIESTPRILFVCGGSLSDTGLRPAAEFYGLLRHLRTSRRRVNARVLQHASPERIQKAMAEFEPHVVHFVCHGDIDEHGRGFLRLEPDEGEEVTDRYAEQLLQYLGIGGEYPQIVVLGVCRTGHTDHTGHAESTDPAMYGPDRTGPLAAELTEGGIPIVVGMAGKVSNLACRLFTRRFGDALLAGIPVIPACAQGRQFALAQGLSPHISADWAFPTIFASDQIAPDFSVIAVDCDPEESIVCDWLVTYDLERTEEPVFCDRDECFEAYRRLFLDKPVLMIRGPSQFGKTRLLRELAAQAVIDGHIPIAVLCSDSPEDEPPRTINDLRKTLLEAIDRAFETYGLGLMENSRLASLAYPEGTELDPEIRHALKRDEGKVTARVLQKALAADLAELVEKARSSHDHVRKAGGRAVVLLDQAQQYDKDFLEGLHKDLGPFGLGSDKNNPVPLVMAFAHEGPAVETLKRLIERSSLWQYAADLRPFSPEEDEDLMVYKRVLLHPFNPKLFPKYSDKAYAFDENADKNAVETVVKCLRGGVKGIPGKIVDASFYMLVPTALYMKVLVEADDTALLEEMREKL